MIEEPGRIKRLPHDKHGRPVPWFVAWIDGKPDFRIVKPGAAPVAWGMKLCWTCGVLFTRQERRAFVVGPMCGVNRVSSEPPSHAECATYSARVCPFLTTPRMTRRDRHLPPDVSDPAGTMIRRNPGVALVWVTRYNSPSMQRLPDGVLFDIGEPEWVEWYCQGRQATRSEVLASIESGLPELVSICDGDPLQLAALEAQRVTAMRLVPA